MTRLKLIFLLILLPSIFPASLYAQNFEEIGGELSMIFRSARKAISDNQPLINDATKGDKGLTAAKVIALTKDNYASVAGKPYEQLPVGTLMGDAQINLFAAISTVINKAQPIINESGKGFKGFIPAVFGRQVSEIFSNKMNKRALMKLTAPSELIRNNNNQPDDWEAQIMKNKFQNDSWPKTKTYSEEVVFNGHKAFRMMIPEYYQESCLKCHGGPKGDIDVSGGKKEGMKLGDLGGAFSLVFFR